ncbi:hypothetical protein S245_028125 [Arachis hypogaea]|nr:Alcohol dehydrogenase-like [Arachis hypogaea]
MSGPEVDANGNGSLKLKPSETRGKNIQYRAAVAYGPGEPFVVEQVIVHPPQKMEVRIKIRFSILQYVIPI